MKKLILILATFLIFTACDNTPVVVNSAPTKTVQKIKGEGKFLQYRKENGMWSYNVELTRKFREEVTLLGEKRMMEAYNNLTQDERHCFGHYCISNPVTDYKRKEIKIGMHEIEIRKLMGSEGLITMHQLDPHFGINVKMVEWKNLNDSRTVHITFTNNKVSSIMFL